MKQVPKLHFYRKKFWSPGCSATTQDSIKLGIKGLKLSLLNSLPRPGWNAYVLTNFKRNQQSWVYSKVIAGSLSIKIQFHHFPSSSFPLIHLTCFGLHCLLSAWHLLKEYWGREKPNPVLSGHHFCFFVTALRALRIPQWSPEMVLLSFSFSFFPVLRISATEFMKILSKMEFTNSLPRIETLWTSFQKWSSSACCIELWMSQHPHVLWLCPPWSVCWLQSISYFRSMCSCGTQPLVEWMAVITWNTTSSILLLFSLFLSSLHAYMTSHVRMLHAPLYWCRNAGWLNLS